MSASTVLILFVIAIIISIIVNTKTGLNIGFVGGICAYIIGCFLCGLSVNTIIGYTPTSIAFQTIILSIFFAFPAQNGTLDKLARQIIYACRNATWALPFVIFFAAWLVSAMGAGSPVGVITVGVIAFQIAKNVNIHPLIITVTLSNASAAGSQFPWSGTGITVYGLLRDLYGDTSYSMSVKSALIFTVYSLLFTAVLCLIFGGFKAKKVGDFEIEKPEPFDSKQKKTLTLIIVLLALIIGFSLLKTLIPSSAVIKKIAGYMDFQMLAIVGIGICVIGKLGDEREAVAKAPWSMIVMLTGMSMLMGIAKTMGALDLVTEVLSTNSSPRMLGAAFALLAGVMTFFSSGVVTMQLLFPMAAPLVASLGLNATGVMTAIAMTARLAAVSPFSTGGALAISTAGNIDAKQQRTLLIGHIVSAVVIIVTVCIFSILGLFNI